MIANKKYPQPIWRIRSNSLYSYAGPMVVALAALVYSLGGEVSEAEAIPQVAHHSEVFANGAKSPIDEVVRAELSFAALTVLYGCTDPNACNFDFYTDCVDLSALLNDWGGPCEYLDDGSCVYAGCTDWSACNFDSTAGCDDGSCEFPDSIGICGGNCLDSDVDGDFICDNIDQCTDFGACNYNDPANDPCSYFDALGICGGGCWDDLDQDLICDDIDLCTDFDACNFDDPNNAPCLYADTIYNCGDVCFDPTLEGGLLLEGNLIHGTLTPSPDGAAIGDLSLQVDTYTYGPIATTVIQNTPFTIPVINGLCGNDEFTLLWEHEFCYNALTVLYNGPATFVSESTPEGIDCSGECLTGGDSNEDGICDYLQTGCGDPAACNFDATAIFGGPCEYPEWGFDCSGIYGAGYCGPGTVWDSMELQCVPVEDSCASDVDGNGVVGINDLLQVLVDYALICP
jgi:hypothetical protein